MNFLKKLFGIPTKEQGPEVSSPAVTEPEFIRVRDAEGRELCVTRQDWYDKMLARRFKESWDDPEQLADAIADAMKDDFFRESVGPAERMVELEDSCRSSNLLADAYLGAGRIEDAERVIRGGISRQGTSAANLTNLAHVKTLRRDYSVAEATLLRALQIDPNYERALCWYESGHREQGGETAGLAAISRIASLPGAWRPQLWLGQHAMNSEQPERALALFRECVEKVSRPVPIDVLADISAALGSAGYFSAIEDLVEPAFEPSVHGLHVGNNLMRAHAEMGEFGKAEKILDQLCAIGRPEWEAQLKDWAAAIASTKVEDPNP